MPVSTPDFASVKSGINTHKNRARVKLYAHAYAWVCVTKMWRIIVL